MGMFVKRRNQTPSRASPSTAHSPIPRGRKTPFNIIPIDKPPNPRYNTSNFIGKEAQMPARDLEGSAPVVLYSGGLNSTALLLHLISTSPPLPVLHSLTHAEFPEIEETVERMDDLLEREWGVRMLRVESPGFFPSARRAGFPSPRNRWCTQVLKTTPSAPILRGRVAIVGYGLGEERRLREGQEAPLLELGASPAAQMRICKAFGFTFGGLYEKLRRSGCYPCPFRSPKEARIVAEGWPNLWARVVDLERELRERGVRRWQWRWDCSAVRLLSKQTRPMGGKGGAQCADARP